MRASTARSSQRQVATGGATNVAACRENGYCSPCRAGWDGRNGQRLHWCYKDAHCRDRSSRPLTAKSLQPSPSTLDGWCNLGPYTRGSARPSHRILYFRLRKQRNVFTSELRIQASCEPHQLSPTRHLSTIMAQPTLIQLPYNEADISLAILAINQN
ncbi:uncharacterized protein CC84DRAFT_707932 [Paraphaeosphaeria sporulosa]|uniref:Uncharacterized protein n=1 Tax=Paraphaeosphaeria sporulosa TaxID=1460663 RepID=A0A177CLQ9_9PLEO|nr:uncharacterized protein CC84DRAFT_707932 [Paraphaeosphaeria sporulosa]OAG07717.1 hypothetical protein CC84DRAFT_707932 [Paraphaeosphaeria sporulosa]